jgi:hypothetical protein
MLGRRVSKDVQERYSADQELAATYRDKLTAAADAEQALRQAQGEARPDPELRALSLTLDQAFADAIRAAEASERVAMGPKIYASDDPKTGRTAAIAQRKAAARWSVKPWTDEVDRLRTAREAHKLSFRSVARA